MTRDCTKRETSGVGASAVPVAAPWGLVAELVLKQIERPAGTFPAAQCLADEHPMPDDFFIWAVLLRLRLAADHEPKLALYEIDIAPVPFRDPAARPTWRLALQDGRAFRAAR